MLCFPLLVSGFISNLKVISSCFHTFVIISAQDRFWLLFHELRMDLDSSPWPAIDKVMSAAGKNISYCPQRRNLTHGSPKFRYSREPMGTSVIPYHLFIQMICPVLNVHIIVTNNIGLKTASLFLSDHRLPTLNTPMFVMYMLAIFPGFWCLDAPSRQNTFC